MPPEMAALLKTIEQLQADKARLAAERDAAIAARDKISALESRPGGLTRLKIAAAIVGVPYEQARRWCARGFLKSARQQGGLWLVDADELRAVAACACHRQSRDAAWAGIVPA
jgi:hypothetical protein